MDVQHYQADVVHEFRRLRALADRAMTQVDDESFFRVDSPGGNSIAIIVKHMAGNMRSRWRDFLTADGEKPDRNRDAEFIIEPRETRSSLLDAWESGWQTLFGAIEPLTAAGFETTVTIRGERHTVMQAIQRQISHYAYHVGQIVILARQAVGERWTSLSIPRGGSTGFNADPSSYLGKPGR